MFFDLNTVEVSEKDRKKILPAIESSWLAVHALTVEVPHTRAGIEFLLKIIRIEKDEGGNRTQIIHRLYRKAASIRRELEEAKLYAE